MNLLLGLFLLTPGAFSSTTTVTLPLVMERFEELDRRLLTFSADFRQFVRWENSETRQSIEGRIDYRKKDRLRIEHRRPESQTIVADGEHLWIWRRSTNQVIKTRLKDWKRSEPLAQGLLDFGSYSELLKRYHVALSTPATLTLTPKGKKEDFSLVIKISPRDYFPYDTEMRVGNVTIHSVFENVRFNPELPDSLFLFTPPPGSDVFVKPPKESHGP